MNDPEIPDDESARRRAGLILGLSGYLFWGGMPLIFAAAQPAGPVEILAHRIVWSLVTCVLLLTAARGYGRVLTAFRNRGVFWTLALASFVVAINWFGFLLGVQLERVIEISLGYFFNPLVTVFLGVVFLGEKLRPLQWVAMAVGTIAVVVIAVGYGQVPWLALLVSFSFGLYGLIKNKVGGRVGALEGLTVESTVLTPFALAAIAWFVLSGNSHFGTEGVGHTLIMLSLGPVTAIPLILFGAATRRVPLSWVGMMQYITPTMQFILGVTVLGEEMSTARWIGFFIIWSAVAILTVDMVRASRRRPRR
ncbi:MULTISPECIES: EamA family transporter RarD [Brevibacterium]|uniref:EamA family transporter RarD n=1 Tax=Brevibacterium pityocampae TaxID=506594 RepID=A0ABP8J5W4_9MICO|nr:EamA family transporter RarD [Brevibacterium sp. CS2]